MSLQEAINAGVEYQNILIDHGYTPSILMAGFTDNGGAAYCNSWARVPTVYEMEILIEADPSNVYNWPTSSQYLVNDNGEYVVMPITGGDETSYKVPVYLTCVSGVSSVDINIHLEDDSPVPADGIQSASVVVELRDLEGKPLSDVIIHIDLDGVAEAPSSVVTDNDGYAIFGVSSTLANTVSIRASVTDFLPVPPSVSVELEFIGDLSTAYLTSFWVRKKFSVPDGKDYIDVLAQAEDTHGNLVEGAEVELSFEKLFDFTPEFPSPLPSKMEPTSRAGQSVLRLSSTVPGRYLIEGHLGGVTFREREITFGWECDAQQGFPCAWEQMIITHEEEDEEHGRVKVGALPVFSVSEMLFLDYEFNVEDSYLEESGKNVVRLNLQDTKDFCHFLGETGYAGSISGRVASYSYVEEGLHAEFKDEMDFNQWSVGFWYWAPEFPWLLPPPKEDYVFHLSTGNSQIEPSDGVMYPLCELLFEEGSPMFDFYKDDK
ncbi:hypothetical protein F9L16_17720 [Agarivorans sp. B2Z047]|uniref:Ig-like domain-containing protein n=1 Tax=Agarivorans sp. B2Z047 TaxID=2652721 RepID=UPI00128BB6C4|nr:Ig-like domain-containing protein [Agarivorans sp. B2Z047]MPW30827.1 hypothetical protein [Agarivorans sp. B2Z047]UQN40942.1 Ig-like domain-containing protein [Agarivorans sp. B2Z047]